MSIKDHSGIVLDNSTLHEISAVISKGFGISYQENRFPELQNKLSLICKELKIKDIDALLKMLKGHSLSEAQRIVVIKHLTVGETFFYRDRKVFEVFQGLIMPEIISTKSPQDRHIKILSVGCSTGEEPYTIAIIIKRHFGNLKDYHIEITGIDINEDALEAARRGLYSQWSFRGTPEWLKPGYFRRVEGNKYELSHEIRSMVSFELFNLAQKGETLHGRFGSWDLIFCRNVLMYFDEALRSQVADMLYNALLIGGWLIVSPVEASATVFERFERVIHQRITLFRRAVAGTVPILRSDEKKVHKSPKTNPKELPRTTPKKTSNPTHIVNKSSDISGPVTVKNKEYGLPERLREIKVVADGGMLDNALSMVNEAIKKDSLDPAAHFLKALILEELGDLIGAEAALRGVLYLEHNSALARFRLGNIYLKGLNKSGAMREFQGVITLLRDKAYTDPLKDFSDMNTDRLMEITNSLIREIEIA